MRSVDLKKMRRISIIWGIIMFLLIAGVTILGIVYKEESKKYKEYETKLVEKSEDYMRINNLSKITIEELKEQNLIEQTSVAEKECTGYVLKAEEKYQAYVKCGNYKTKGYAE